MYVIFDYGLKSVLSHFADDHDFQFDEVIRSEDAQDLAVMFDTKQKAALVEKDGAA